MSGKIIICKCNIRRRLNEEGVWNEMARLKRIY